MAEEQKQIPAEDIEAMKKELAEIKSEMMKKELEDIRREKMWKELEEMKAESKQGQELPKAPQKTQYIAPYEGKVSIPNVFIASAALLAAGYMICTLYTFNIAAEVDKLIARFQVPITGTMIVAIASAILVFVGIGMVTIARK
jgi:ribosome-binding ATPase YchF (GTP1/OBG family)